MLHKPLHTLLYLAIVFILLGSITFVFPKEGISIYKDFTLKFPHYTSFLKKEISSKKNVSNIIALADKQEKLQEQSIDSSSNNELILKDSSINLITGIQYKNNTRTALFNFFNSLLHIANEPKSIRVLHYGDSQIEGDRISDYLRLKLQTQFGGEGPGFISFMPVAPSVINKLTWSNTWDRYCVFAGKDKRVKHNNYGVMAQFCRFMPYKVIDSNATTTSAWVKIVTSKNGGVKTASYKKLKLFYGGAQTKTHIELYENGTLNNSDSLQAGGTFNIKEYSLTQGPLLHEFKFKGKDSPDFYGVSLESNTGVMVDNMGLRGSSGTFFNQINFSQLKSFYDYLNTKLIILQFGGNSLPYIKDKTQADNYANYLKYQIITIKKLAPKSSILVIGPSDMSVKEGTTYVTHPQLENLRDAIRTAAFETDCAFFDMYDCMGGKNSMLTWVEEGIAAKDYIHFSPAGARKIATLLYSSLIKDYNAFAKKNK